MAAWGFSFGEKSPNSESTDQNAAEVQSILQDVTDLHNLDEGEWSFKRHEMSFFSPTCKVSYNSARKVIRVRMSFKVPLLEVMTHYLHPPYGYRSTEESRECRVEIIDDLGKYAVVVYSEGYKQTHMLFPITVRDVVALQAIKFLSPTVAIFNSKTVERPSRPPKEGFHRIHAPLAGFYFEQEGDKTRVEAYVSDMDMGGDIGKVKSKHMIDILIKKMSKIARSLPGKQPPPERLSKVSGGLSSQFDFAGLADGPMPIALGRGLGHVGLELLLAEFKQ